MWDLRPPAEVKLDGLADIRMISAMRLLLAASSLLIIHLDPSQPDRFVAITYVTLVLYTAYSAVLFCAARLSLRTSKRGGAFLSSVRRGAHWIDIGWYSVLVALSSGTNSLFFFGFFFAILVASFRWGFASGYKAVFVSAVIFTLASYLTFPSEPVFEWNRFLLRSTSILVLGYMIAHWGGSELSLKRKLALLKEVTALSNPRFGVDRTIANVMEKVRAFYDADTGLIIGTGSRGDEYYLRRASREETESATHAEPIPTDFADLLLGFPSAHAIIYHDKWPGWLRSQQKRFVGFDITTGKRLRETPPLCERLAGTLNTESFVSVPTRYRNQITGRFYLTGKHRFRTSDIDFLLQLVEQVAPVIDNIRLVDRIASDAAEEERHRLARSIHDNVIQTYLGIQMALRGASDRIADRAPDAAYQIEQLTEMTNSGIANLRSYMFGLSEPGKQEGILLPAVRRFAGKFSDTTGISINIEDTEDIRVSDRLSAEAFQIVVEGLSNIRRHTHAARATLSFVCQDEHLFIRIENDHADEHTPPIFTPRSISERAAALGGQARVDVSEDGRTLIEVAIPL